MHAAVCSRLGGHGGSDEAGRARRRGALRAAGHAAPRHVRRAHHHPGERQDLRGARVRARQDFHGHVATILRFFIVTCFFSLFLFFFICFPYFCLSDILKPKQFFFQLLRFLYIGFCTATEFC